MRFLTGQTAQEVQLRPAGVGMPFHHYFVNAGREQKESTLDANPIGSGPADGEIGIVAAFTRADDCALKFLDTLAITFLDADVHAHLITRFQFRDVLVLDCIKVLIQVNHFGFSSQIIFTFRRGARL
jgi:hypothetical protein